MEPHASVGVGVGAVRILQVGLGVGDVAVCAWWRNERRKVVHPVVFTCAWDGEWPVGDRLALGLVLFEEARLEGFGY